MNTAIGSPNALKTRWEKEKLLVTSNFSFSHRVFKRLVMQTRKNQGLFGKGLTAYVSTHIILNFHCVLHEGSFCLFLGYQRQLIYQRRDGSFSTFGNADEEGSVWYKNILFVTHSLIHHFETIPNSKTLQTTTEMWLLKDFKIQIA